MSGRRALLWRAFAAAVTVLSWGAIALMVAL